MKYKTIHFFKAEDKKKQNNYHPVSILCLFGKNLEKFSPSNYKTTQDNNNKDNNLLITVQHNKTYTHKHKKILRRVTTDQSRYNHKGFKGRILLDLHYYHSMSITKIETRRSYLVLLYCHNKQNNDPSYQT